LNRIQTFAVRLWNSVLRRHSDSSLDEEMHTHMALLEEEYMRSGISPENARARARREFGSITRMREDYREQRGFATVEAFWNDMLSACRSLLKRPLLLLTASLSIAAGAGLNISVYSVLSEVLFHTSLSGVRADDHLGQILGVSFPNYKDLLETHAFVNSAAMQVKTLVWRKSTATSGINAKVISPTFFDIAKVTPLRGRAFRTDDSLTVILGFGFWQRQFASNPAILGQTMDLNGWPFVIVGILPKNFNAPQFPFVASDVYVPISPLVCGGLSDRVSAQFDLITRLPDGVSIAGGARSLQLVARELARRFPRENSRLEQSLSLSPVSGLEMWQHMGAGKSMLLAFVSLYAIVGLILAITCANVAGLLLSRAEERHHEVAICAALGASRWRLMQRFAAESSVIAVLGCVIAGSFYAGVTTAAHRLAWSAANVDVLPPSLPFVYCCALILAITVACGFLPSLAVSRMAPNSTLVSLSPRTSRTSKGVAQKLLVIVQVAICFVFLTGSFLLLRAVFDLRHIGPGFDVERTMALNVRLPANTSGTFGSLRETIRRVPGVEAVSCVRYLPLTFLAWRAQVRVDGVDQGAQGAADIFPVGPGYLQTMRIPLVRGRDLSESDMQLPRAAVLPVVVNTTLARRFFGASNPLGRRLVLKSDGAEDGDRRLEVVGVAHDSKLRSLNEDAHPVLYFPELTTLFVLRTAGPAKAALLEIEKAVAGSQPGAAVQATPMTSQIATARLPTEIGGSLLGFLSVLGLSLSMTGLYGVMAYAVSRRTFEIGVRVALGAGRAVIAGSVLRESLVIVAVGCAGGLAVALAVGKIFSPLLTAGESPTDPAVLAMVIVTLLAVGAMASFLPAFRAASVDPLSALRHE
jgi:predicted permease